MRSNYFDLTSLYHLLIAKPIRFRATFSDANDRKRDYSEAKICQEGKILAIQI